MDELEQAAELAVQEVHEVDDASVSLAALDLAVSSTRARFPHSLDESDHVMPGLVLASSTDSSDGSTSEESEEEESDEEEEEEANEGDSSKKGKRNMSTIIEEKHSEEESHSPRKSWL